MSAAQDPNETGSRDPADSADAADDIAADYANTTVELALQALQETPDYAHLAAFLTALREGHLIADVTGTPASRKKGRRVRTIRSTTGQLVLPLFTSMEELRALAPGSRRDEVKGVIMPAREALALIASDRFVAAEFNKASAALVVLRKYVSLAISDREITPALLEGGRSAG